MSRLGGDVFEWDVQRVVQWLEEVRTIFLSSRCAAPTESLKFDVCECPCNIDSVVMFAIYPGHFGVKCSAGLKTASKYRVRS